MSVVLYREPVSKVTHASMSAVIVDRGRLTRTIAASNGNFLFSEPREGSATSSDHAGVKPLVMIGTLPEILGWMSGECRAVSQNRGIENRIGELPEIYMTIDEYVPGERYTKSFPINEALGKLVEGAMQIWGAAEGGDALLDYIKESYSGPSFIGPRLEPTRFQSALEQLLELGENIDSANEAWETADNLIEVSGIRKRSDRKQAARPSQNIQLHIAQGLINAAKDVGTGQLTYRDFKAHFDKLERAITPAQESPEGDPIPYYIRWHYLDAPKPSSSKPGASGAIHSTLLGKHHVPWLGVYHVMKLLCRAGVLPEKKRAAKKRGWFW